MGRYRAAVATDAGLAAGALVATWQHLARALPGAWVRRDGGAMALVSGVALPALNGVWAESADPDPGAVASLLDRAHATGLPHWCRVDSEKRFTTGPEPAKRGSTGRAFAQYHGRKQGVWIKDRFDLQLPASSVATLIPSLHPRSHRCPVSVMPTSGAGRVGRGGDRMLARLGVCRTGQWVMDGGHLPPTAAGLPSGRPERRGPGGLWAARAAAYT